VAAVALLIGSIALLVWAINSGRRAATGPGINGVVAVTDLKARAGFPGNVVPVVAPASGAEVKSPADKPVAGGKRFTLRLGQGFRLKDGALVVNKEDRPDVVFKYLPPQLGGAALRYNPLSQQVEQGLEPTLTSAMPLLVSTHVSGFEEKPRVARITSGDVATYGPDAPVSGKTRYFLVQGQAGDHYLLTLDQLEAPTGKYDDWRIGFSYEPVQLPIGRAGGKINKPLPGKLIYRECYGSKMIIGVDLTTGSAERIADGILPCTMAKGLFAFADTSNAYIIRDVAGKTLHTVRFNEAIEWPQLSPDGKSIVATARRNGPDVMMRGVAMAGASAPAVAVFDLEGRAVAALRGYDDAVWTPEGTLIATGPYNDDGLFEVDPKTMAVKPIDAQVKAPGQVSVSPDGKTIAYITGQKVWLMDRDGKHPRQLFPDGLQQLRPVFSPDGSKVAFVVCNHFPIDFTGEIFVVDLKTKELTPLCTNQGVALIPDVPTRLNWVP